MKHLQQLLDEIKDEYHVLEGEKETLMGKLHDLREQRNKEESAMNPDQQEKGFAEKFKTALGLKKNLDKEILETEDTLNYVDSLIEDKKAQYKINGVSMHQAVLDASKQDTELFKEEVAPVYEEIKNHLEKAIHLYGELGERLSQKQLEYHQTSRQIQNYAPKERKNYISGGLYIKNPSFLKDELQAFYKNNFE